MFIVTNSYYRFLAHDNHRGLTDFQQDQFTATAEKKKTKTHEGFEISLNWNRFYPKILPNDYKCSHIKLIFN